ncbi:MAG: Tn7 transposase TnsA N-terminal domain-containing protein [Planctomycetales bacterium]|nr:Tn7 transposase TnsA N-terminal domain-containing protein [Planctomycetales bacterium]
MARRAGPIDEATIQKWMREGRGAGAFETYRPWLETYDVPSSGRRHRLPSLKPPGRLVHLLSDLELANFLVNEFRTTVVDLREQFPLDRVASHEIALRAGIRHPVTSLGTPHVMTTDLLVLTRSNGVSAFEAIAVKPSSMLENARVIEKLEIERRYWNERDVSWRIFTEEHFHPTAVHHLASIRQFWDAAYFRECLGDIFDELVEELMDLVEQRADELVQETAERLGDCFSIRPQLIADIVKHLLARQLIATDITDRMSVSQRPWSMYRRNRAVIREVV